MTPGDFELFRAQFNDECAQVLFSKGADYASTLDRLANFKRAADRLGLTPMQVWAVYFIKHLDAIFAFAQKGQVESEPIRGRFVDARNYLDLGLAIIHDEKTP